MGAVKRGLATAAALVAGAAVARRVRRPREARPEMGAGDPPAAEGPLDITTGAEGTVHLMMEDGSVIRAGGDVDPDGRLRYLADNLLEGTDRS